MSIIFTENLPVMPYNKAEILRYSGTKKSNAQIDQLLEECLKEVDGKIQNRICYCEFDISRLDNEIDLGFTKFRSRLLKKHLKDCNKIILFACTIGIETDRLISKYCRLSISKALMLQAIGTERIEALCDTFENSLKGKYKKVQPRVSAGYGDIPLEIQKDIFKVLDCPRKIGLSLNESLLMSPTKSVTAIIGIGE